MDQYKIQIFKKELKQTINRNKTFLTFLKQEKVYGRYIKNVINSYIDRCNISKGNLLMHIERNIDPIDRGFFWKETSEHDSFWRTLSKKYDKYKKSIY